MGWVVLLTLHILGIVSIVFFALAGPPPVHHAKVKTERVDSANVDSPTLPSMEIAKKIVAGLKHSETILTYFDMFIRGLMGLNKRLTGPYRAYL